MAEANPVVIQQPESLPTTAPLVLIHDGGGTIAQYYSIGSIGRNVYGIHNFGGPDKSTWKDGITSMAEEYCDMIKELPLPGTVILGGWSLGGVIALEMAQILAEDAKLRVEGILLIESIYPGVVPDEAYIDTGDLVFGTNASSETQQQIYKGLTEGLRAVQSHTISKEPEIPPTVLIRAKSPMPSLSDKAFDFPPMLGWDCDGHDFVKQVYDVSGHHYSIFQDENVPRMTVVIAEACTMLANGVWS